MKFLRTCSLWLVVLMASACHFAVQAADPVSINITGKVVASPCTVAGDSVEKPVNLGQNIQASTLQAAGNATDWVSFDINLISCPAGTTKAIITFHGTADTAHPDDMYKNTATEGAATNLAVQLQGRDGQLFGDGKSYTGTINNNTYAYHLRARAYTDTGNVMPGAISAVVTATFTYQ